jgi:hypothetical protein
MGIARKFLLPSTPLKKFELYFCWGSKLFEGIQILLTTPLPRRED